MIVFSKLLNEDRSKTSVRKGCLMAMVPKEVCEKILAFSQKVIPDQNLYLEGNEYGRETESHVTVRYGFTKDLNELEVRQLLKGYKPFTLEVIEMDKFDSNSNYDVVKFRVDSPVLKELHQISGIYPNESDYPEYNPHLTLAYVKKGSFPHLKEGLRLKIPVRTLCYSPISGDKTYYELDESFQESDYKHSSIKPIEKIKTKQYSQRVASQPEGFWYSIGDEWKKYSKYMSKVGGFDSSYYEYYDREYHYIIRVKDRSKVLLLDTKEKVKSFTEKYGVKPKWTGKTLIKWGEVSKQYDGVEFNPYFGRKELPAEGEDKNFWYNYISIPSGCIWNTDILEITREEKENLTEAVIKVEPHEVVDLRDPNWKGTYIVSLGKHEDIDNRTMVTIARGKIYLYRWGNGNITDWQKVLATVGGQHNDMMSLTPNGSLILPNRVGGDTKWEGARNIFTDTTQLWVKILLVAGVVKPGTKVYIGNWAASNGDFIGSAREIAKRDLSQLPHEMVFYHGTSSDRLEGVKTDGLKPQARELRPWKSDSMKRHPEWREHAIYLTYDKSQADYYARKAVKVARRAGQKGVKKVILKIAIPNTHYKRLLPDDDFLMRQLIWIGVTWLDSLKSFSQVAYLGNIPVGWISVESVADKFGWYEPEKVSEYLVK